MSLMDLLRFAATALVGHRLRTALTVVGLSVGIAAVIALTALGEGARRYVVQEFEGLGTNLLIVMPGRVETSGMMPFGGVVHDLTLEDARAVRGRVTQVREVAPISMATESIRWGGRTRSVAVLGATAAFRELRHLEVASGSFLTTTDLEARGSEAVLGVKVARELFGARQPLGEVVRIGDWRFRVVGVLAPKGRSMGIFDMDDLVIVPVHTGLAMFNRSSLFRILAEVRSHREMEQAKEQLIQVLAARHRAEDVTVISQDALSESFGSILGVMTVALAAIASVSLAVAGVGIMNVMLVSVTERRKEIGLLKALGAGSAQILAVFLAEAIVLSIAGGALGLGVGLAAVAVFVQLVPGFPAAPPLWAVVAAVVLSLAVGVGFGVIPARRATRLDPISALAGR